MSRLYQPRRLVPSQVVFLRAKVVNPSFERPFQKGQYAVVELIDKAGRPIDGVQYFVDPTAPITVSEAVKALTQ